MAVAAAIGVGGDLDPEGNAMLGGPGAHSARLQNKLNKHPSGQRSFSAGLGEINTSIEKMTLGSTNVGSLPTPMPPKSKPPPSYKQSTMRRDSNWTNSSEGYGSMRSSDPMVSRRCSEVSVMSQGSNFSTTAVRNSPWVDHSAPSSRRSSLAPNDLTGMPVNPANPNRSQGMSQHLSRLQQKADSLAMSGSQPPSQVQHHQQGRRMSDCGVTSVANHQLQQMHPGAHQPNDNTARRASDPVRSMDRNFGVNGQMSRHRSYSQLNGGQVARQPIHGHQVRGLPQQQFGNQPMPNGPQVIYLTYEIAPSFCAYFDLHEFNLFLLILILLNCSLDILINLNKASTSISKATTGPHSRVRLMPMVNNNLTAVDKHQMASSAITIANHHNNSNNNQDLISSQGTLTNNNNGPNSPSKTSQTGARTGRATSSPLTPTREPLTMSSSARTGMAPVDEPI